MSIRTKAATRGIRRAQLDNNHALVFHHTAWELIFGQAPPRRDTPTSRNGEPPRPENLGVNRPWSPKHDSFQSSANHGNSLRAPHILFILGRVMLAAHAPILILRSEAMSQICTSCFFPESIEPWLRIENGDQLRKNPVNCANSRKRAELRRSLGRESRTISAAAPVFHWASEAPACRI